jgi:hypothetical protein
LAITIFSAQQNDIFAMIRFAIQRTRPKFLTGPH